MKNLPKSCKNNHIIVALLLPLLLIGGKCFGEVDPATGTKEASGFTESKPMITVPHSATNSVYTWHSPTALGYHSTYRKVNDVRRYGFHELPGRNLVVERRFDGVHSTFSEGFGGVKVHGKWGFVNANDEVVVEPVYDQVFPFSEGRAVVKSGDRFGLIDATGKQVVEVDYDHISSFSEGLATIHLEERSGCIDRQGSVVIPLDFYGIGLFSEGLASFSYERSRPGNYATTGILNKQGQVVMSPRFCSIGLFSEGLAAVRIGDRWDWDMKFNGLYGYCDREGNIVIEPKFFSAQPFFEGLAAAQAVKGEHGPGLWGYIDKSGAWAIAPQYRLRPSGFSQGIAMHYSGVPGQRVWIDKDGNRVPKPARRW